MTTRPTADGEQDQVRRDLALVPAAGGAPPLPPRLPGGDCVLGRDAACDVVLDDPAVSRHHTRLAWQDGVWWVLDLGSSNGTLLDGAPVNQAVLTDGSALQIGPFAWTVQLAPPRTPLRAADGLLVWRLEGDDPRLGGLRRLLWSRQVVLGRSDTSDVVVRSDQVSALHARLASGAGGFVVTDLGSANGIRVNGRPVRTARLQDGDRLEIADLPLRVRRTWIPAPPVLGAAGVLTVLLLVLALLPMAGRRSLELDRWWTRDMYLEQAQRSLQDAVAAWQRPQPARELARASFAIALRSLAAVDYLPPGVPDQADIAVALRRAELEFGGPLRDLDLHAILQELDRPEPPPVATGDLAEAAVPPSDRPQPERPEALAAPPAAEPPAAAPGETFAAGPATAMPYDLRSELSLIMAEFGIDTASQPVPADLVAAIDHYVDFWTGEMRGFTRRAWRRGQEHLPLIETTLRRHRLPEVFAYLPFIESGFQVDVTSHAGARGLWQFMPGTARQYGLRVDDQVDERTDPVKATEAACQYLEYLLNAFGATSFMSAVAAYNKGEYGMLRCLGRGADWRSRWNFWDIATRGDGCLKPETIAYVPKFLAAAVVLRRPDVFVIEGGGA